jgi:hypothetical protein
MHGTLDQRPVFRAWLRQAHDRNPMASGLALLG